MNFIVYNFLNLFSTEIYYSWTWSFHIVSILKHCSLNNWCFEFFIYKNLLYKKIRLLVLPSKPRFQNCSHIIISQFDGEPADAGLCYQFVLTSPLLTFLGIRLHRLTVLNNSDYKFSKWRSHSLCCVFFHTETWYLLLFVTFFLHIIFRDPTSWTLNICWYFRSSFL